MTDNVHVIHSSDGVELTMGEYARSIGKSTRTVQRWLKDGEIPGAHQDDVGRWYIPSGARRRTTSGGDVVSSTTSHGAQLTTGHQVDDVDQLGQLVPLDVAAVRLRTTVGGVRRMADDGLVRVGPYGPHGALRAFVPGH